MATLHDFHASAHTSASTLVRWTLRLLAPYRRPLVMLASLSAAEVACRVASPWALKTVVDHVFGSAPAPVWLRASAGAIGTPLAGGSTRGGLLLTIVGFGLIAHLAHQAVLMLHTRLFAALGQRLTRDLREQLFAHLQCLALAHHARTPAGDAVYRLNADANCLEQIVLRAWIPAVSSAATLIVMFAVLATISVPLALVSLAVVPGLYLSLRLHSRRVHGEAERVKALESRVIERAHESFATIRLVKAFAREPYERARFSGASHDAMRARVSLSRREATFSFAVGALTASGTSLVLAAGGALVLRGDISAGTLLLVLAYLGFVYGPLTALTNTTSIVRDAFASARRVRQVFALTTEPLDVLAAPNSTAISGASGAAGASAAPHGTTGFAASATLPIGSLTGAVRFDQVSFAYEPGRDVLHDLSFTAHPGELIAIVGPSGSGKTTITSLITRLYEPTRGRILLDGGIDSRACSLRTLREQIAVVLQEALLLSGTVRDNLRYGRLDASDAEIEEAARQANAHEFITRLPRGYDTELGEAGAMLSGGQRQRLSIARAFLKHAPILILDEPTSALDTLSESHFIDVLGRLRGNGTTFVIAHRLSTVRRADRILVLDAGRLVSSGTHDELLRTSPLYAQLAGAFTDAASEAADSAPDSESRIA